MYAFKLQTHMSTSRLGGTNKCGVTGNAEGYTPLRSMGIFIQDDSLISLISDHSHLHINRLTGPLLFKIKFLSLSHGSFVGWG